MPPTYFGPAGVDMGGTGAKPGQVVAFPALLVAARPRTITLLSASLVAVPGFPLPRLSHLSVVSGCGLDLPAFAVGWPTVISGSHATARQVPFAGAKVWTGARKGCTSAVLYGIQSPATGPFAIAGLQLTFSAGSQRASALVYNGGFAWFHNAIDPSQRKAFRSTFTKENDAAFRRLDELAHSG